MIGGFIYLFYFWGIELKIKKTKKAWLSVRKLVFILIFIHGKRVYIVFISLSCDFCGILFINYKLN